MKKKYFEGYYVKLQGKEESIICIPSFHYDERGVATANLQISCSVFQIEIRRKEFTYQKKKDKFYIKIGSNIFTNKGCKISIQEKNILLEGVFSYGTLTPLRKDIMGYFRYIPFLQCRHSVYSMYHSVNGKLKYNQEVIYINDGIGYMEGDRGCDFPKHYFWTQAIIEGKGSIMISVATVPLLNKLLPIKGCIAVLCYKGKEYKIATYLGASIKRIDNNKIILEQGGYRLMARVLKGEDVVKLSAPKSGLMKRNIQEKVSTSVYYSLCYKRKVIFDEVIKQASAEQEWLRQ